MIYTIYDMIMISIPVVVSLLIMLESSFFMIEKRNIYLFLPFFFFGFIIIVSTVFSYYGVFSGASIIHRVLRVLAYSMMLFIIWRATRQ